ncbi:hypothetical protein [Nocardia sp. alder85J]|uniref:hypothetical protein n=1 Tax=Nocardia sp. alder85J TaxID=2862949 RepID=UPI001CD5E82A|nr:hypothetical protein [Nocardia sp. alder85J]MCX4097778.1 hypothetical protein [Nocardia sp. alder85J]
MRYSKPGRKAIGDKYEVRLEPTLAAAVARYGETRWPGNKHAAAKARRELIEIAIHAHQRSHRIMSTVRLVVLGSPTDAPGMEWGSALNYVPDIEDAPGVEEFLKSHGVWDNEQPDAYVLVVPVDLWDAELNGNPNMAVEVPQTQCDSLTAELAEGQHS